MFNDAPDIVKEFLFYIETIKNHSTKTVDGYYIDLRTFFRFIKLQKGLVDDDTEFKDISIKDVDFDIVKSITTLDVYEYLSFIKREALNDSKARARKLSCLRAYFGYLCNKVNKLEINPVADIEIPSVRKSLPKYLTLEESKALLNSVSGDYYERDYLILTLFLNCGMRLSELVGINVYDIREDTVKITGKGSKERLVYLNDACMYAVKNYQAVRGELLKGDRTEQALLLNRNGRRLTGRRVEQIVENYLLLSGLSGKGYSPHKLRHTAATLMYQHGGVDMLALKEILGHEHVSTTEIYTHIGNEGLRKAMSSSPLSSVKIKKKKSNDESSKG